MASLTRARPWPHASSWLLAAGGLFAAFRSLRRLGEARLLGEGGFSVPRDRSLDATAALLADPYRFIASRCEELGTDVFETRLGLRKVLCGRGEALARLFYEPGLFTRRGALPPTALALLQDRGSAATLDGEAHRHRKQMLLSLMGPDRMATLGELLDAEWLEAASRWERQPQISLMRELPELLCRVACAWAGVPLREGEAGERARELSAMYEGAGSVGPRNWKGMLLRSRTERWCRKLVRSMRAGEIVAPEASALSVIALHRGLDGELLGEGDAAVELINILRPVVAVERFITFTAHALLTHPEHLARLRRGDEAFAEAFVNEVRRAYPFFPAVAGRSTRAFTWRGSRFPEGTWLMLDLYGTDHDPRLYSAPDAFLPDRFMGRQPGPFELVPQGGGGHLSGHRCAGERATIELMKRSLRWLSSGLRYQVLRQDFSIDMGRIPAAPAGGLVLGRVRRAVADAPDVAWASP